MSTQEAGADRLKIDNKYLCGSTFTRVSLKGSSFTDAHFMETRFEDVNFTGTAIENANLTGVKFHDVNLSNAHISYANLSGLAIADANLEGMTINGILVSDLFAAYEAPEHMSKPIRINLALQGGGAHGAFTWGVLDRLLEEDDIEIEGITATSAGAMNAAALKAGWIAGGNAGARKSLDEFWEALTASSTPDLSSWFTALTPDPALFARLAEKNPAYLAGDALTRVFSPYELNPFNIHPLRPLVEGFFCFDEVCAADGPQLFISATNVRTGKIKVFAGKEVGVDALLASACLPTLYQAVEIEDEKTGKLEAYWDGGYLGNPALFPLFYETKTSDILIVHINPIHREEVPHTSMEILNRINEISFNSSLLRELRAIDFVRRLIEDGSISSNTMKSVHIHSIMDDALMTQLSAATKLTPNRQLLETLKAAGRVQMDTFLKDHKEDLGKRGTVDLRAMFE